MKIALIGYGKMGHAIEEAALSRGHEIVCRIDKDNQEDFDSVSFKSADVAIEFTAPSVAVDNYRRAFAAGVPVVSGTTGWLEHLPEIREACEKGQTFFYASNFSLGVNIFFAVNKYLAGIMNHFPQYSVEIEEIHHIHKLDHPSGTAITLAEDIIGQLDAKHSWSENMPPDAKGKYPVHTPSPMTVPWIRYASPMRRKTEKGLPSGLSSPPNLPSGKKDFSPCKIYSHSSNNI
jgi:4-hydroxy-tetrahydrodipicolinate reductase